MNYIDRALQWHSCWQLLVDLRWPSLLSLLLYVTAPWAHGHGAEFPRFGRGGLDLINLDSMRHPDS